MSSKEIRYYSTNGNAEKASFKEALLRGQAPDKGLYMPDKIPKLSQELIRSMKKMPYSEIAFTIIKQFTDIPEEHLLKITREAYDFEIPLERVYGNIHLMRLDKGPTCSFKDFAARTMARLMRHYLEKENKKLVILTATSGDTGSAVANAFYKLKGIKVIVLFPEKEVSEIQRRQMTTLGNNIISIAIEGKFDDCQALVKQAFADPELQDMGLSSANSINIGRLLPQSAYYFYAYSRLAANKEAIFSVPSGNFGNLMGGLIAKRMGLPVSKFIAATNENDEFPNFLRTGRYAAIRPSRACISNAMNVGHPSNLARLIALYGGRMDEKGNILKQPDMDKMREGIFAASISDNETRATIKEAYGKYGKILEPHGAVAFAGLQRFLKNNKAGICISLETADPAKFPDEIMKAINIQPPVPRALDELKYAEDKFEKIPACYEDFKEFLLKEE